MNGDRSCSIVEVKSQHGSTVVLFIVRTISFSGDSDNPHSAKLTITPCLLSPYDLRPNGAIWSFDGSFEKWSPNASGGSVDITHNAIYIAADSLRGLHVGSYCLGEIVEWAHTNFPSALIAPITLSEGDGKDPNNRARRNRLYERFNIKFSYADDTKTAGVSEPMFAKDLEPRPCPDNITVYPSVVNYFRDRLYELTSVRGDLDRCQRAVQESDAALRHARRSITWPHGPLVFLTFIVGVVFGRLF